MRCFLIDVFLGRQPSRFILGEAPPQDAVIINGDTNNPAARPGGLGFYWKQITADNSSGPLWSTVTVTSNGVTITGQAWTPAASVTPGYDFDGNLTNDGRWAYVWDAENRLIRMTTTDIAAASGVPRQRLDFVYDSQNRRVSKTVSTSPEGTTWTLVSDRRFLYDGWNLIAEYSAPLPTSTTLTYEASYLWGLDISGTPQGAGGVGGLLAVFEISNSEISNRSYPAYDGNGNISAWISASGTLLARMDYSPFGQLIAHYKFTDPAILSRLPFGFSTKYTDAETGLLYYGNRYYDPVNGRWQSRDPIGERGGVNLYGFVGNNAIGWLDILGRTPTSEAEYVIIKTKTSLDLNGVGAAFYDPNDTKFWKKITGSSITPEQWMRKLLGPDTTLVAMTDLAGFLRRIEDLPRNQKIAILDHGAFDTKSGNVYPYLGTSIVQDDADWEKLAVGLAKVAKEVVFCGCNMGRGPDEEIEPGSQQNMDRLAGLCELGTTVIASNVVNIAAVRGPSTSFVPHLDTTNLRMEASWFRIEKMSRSDFMKKLSSEDRTKYMDTKEKEHQILKIHQPAKLRK